MTNEISWQQFEAVEIRVGEIISVHDYPEARKPSYWFIVDFGDEIGRKKSVAQLPANYTSEQLVGRRVACVVNFPPRQIGKHKSEVLTLGFPDKNGDAILVSPDRLVPLGGKLF